MDSTQAIQNIVTEALAYSGARPQEESSVSQLLGNEQVAGWIGSQIVDFLRSGNAQHLFADLQNVMSNVDGAMTHYAELTERNAELAAALGACTCWGEFEYCETCHGEGASGWMRPEKEMFSLLVVPALVNLNRSKTARIGHKRTE